MEKVIDLTKQLIEIPSVSGNEGDILRFLEDFLTANGAETIRTDDFVAGIFSKKTTDMLPTTKKAVILTGHIDTVTSGDLSGWKESPWQAIEESKGNEGQKIIGLGASDMKAGIASSFWAGIDFWAKNKDTVDFDLWLVAVSNEEIDGSGSAKFVEWLKNSGRNYEEIYGIISEPTGNQQIEVGHRGNRFVNLEFEGISGHASQQGNFNKSALAKVSNFIADLDVVCEKLQEEYSNEILGSPSLVPTSLQAGDYESPNKTAAKAGLTVDIRTTPELDDNFEDFTNKLGKKYGFSWSYHSDIAPSCLISKNSKVVEALKQATNLSDDSLVVSPGATDQAFFVQGVNAEVVVFGPGEFSQAHRQNEFVYTKKVIDFYEICLKFLGKI